VKLLIKSLKQDLSRRLIEDHHRTAIGFLGKIGDASAVKTLISVLQAKPWRQTSSARQEAALALGEIGDEQAVEPLIVTLSVKDEYVAGTSAEGIHHYGDFEMNVHRAAEKALEKIGAPAITPMVNAFKTALPGSYARIALKITIGNIHDPQAVEPLTSILQDEDLKSDEITEDLHRAARDALKGIDTPGAKAALKTFNLV
jgi:HEAT repeat protein